MTVAAPEPNSQTVLAWHAECLSLAEIGRRIGVSPGRLREILAAAGADLATLEDPSADDDIPNKAADR